jgi:hypothetical protein
MKLLTEIPEEYYNDTQYCYDYLNSHKTLGDEETNYNGVFHVHWRGPIDNDKVILQLKSILATQQVEKIYFWIENKTVTFMSAGYSKVNQFNKYVEIKIFDKSVFDQATGYPKNKERIWMYYSGLHGDRRYKTDMFRWIILNIYGGIYTDADTLLLRDIQDIRIKNWCAKWSTAPYLEGCIIKLEKGSDVYEQMYLNNPNNSQCFLMIQNELPEAFNFKHTNLNITSLPDPFFDIVWPHKDGDLKCLTLNNFDLFFKETDKETTLDNFFKGCFAYHWHNRWEYPELKNSFAGKLNQHIDKIIEEKYKIKPYKIFQG